MDRRADDEGLASFLVREAEHWAETTAGYERLVAQRRACTACAGLTNPSAVADGAFDGPAIGPWSRWHGRLDADLMVVGQDYGDVAYFAKHRGLEDPVNPTNRNLIALLNSVGFSVGLPGTEIGFDSLFFTNAILCLKSNGVQGKVRSEWFEACGTRFLRAQIELVRPRVVVSLGERAHNAVLNAFGLSREPIREAVRSPGTALPNGSIAVGVYHCGARVTNMTRSRELQKSDWKRVAVALHRHAV